MTSTIDDIDDVMLTWITVSGRPLACVETVKLDRVELVPFPAKELIQIMLDTLNAVKANWSPLFVRLNVTENSSLKAY
jgi:hypothetical protein